MPFNYSEVLKIMEVGPYELHNPAGNIMLNFRVEILQRGNTKELFAQIFRREILRVQPTFPQLNGSPIADQYADHEILISDNFIGARDFSGQSVDEVLIKIKCAFDEMFSDCVN